jgi:hypothetical protein
MRSFATSEGVHRPTLVSNPTDPVREAKMPSHDLRAKTTIAAAFAAI